MSPSDEDVPEPGTGERQETEPAAGRGKVLIASVAVVAVLVVAGVVVYLLTSGDDSDDRAGQAQDVPTITGSPAPTTPGTSGATVAPPATATGATGVTGTTTSTPEEIQGLKSVAEQAATAISGADVTTLNKLSCDPVGSDAEDTFPTDAKAEVVGEPKITGDTATIDLKLTIGDSETTTVPMPLIKKDGRWCIPS